MNIQSPPPERIPGATRMSELDPAEHLLVWSFRRWVSGLVDNAGAHWSMAGAEFDRRLGRAHGSPALAALARLVTALQAHATRPITYHRPCCPCLGADEAALVGLIAACQRGAWPAARRTAAGLVDEGGIGDLLAAGRTLARLLAERGERLGAGRESADDPLGAANGGHPEAVSWWVH